MIRQTILRGAQAFVAAVICLSAFASNAQVISNGGLGQGTSSTNASVQKICDPITIAPNGDYALTCHLAVTASAPFPAQINIHDSLNVGGATLGGVSSNEPWACTDSATGSSLDVDCTLGLADIPPSGSSTIDIAMTIPAGSGGFAYNCADGSYEIAGAEPRPISRSCAHIVLPSPPQPPDPAQCTAFQAEVSCDEATGETIVTFTSPLASFTPDDIDITILTPGITMSTPAGGAPLSVSLTGAAPGQIVSVLLDAVHTGGGSAPGLDKCCLGETEVQIPDDFICEKPPVLEVEKTCDTLADAPYQGPYGMPQCEITVHYEGPAPTADDPLVLDDSITTHDGTLLANTTSTDNWQCTAPGGSVSDQIGCTISDADQPGTDWSDWTSTILIPALGGEGTPLPPGSENCATVSIGGLEAQDCWQNSEAALEIEKTGPEICYFGEPCLFTYTITNPGGGDFNGDVTLGDYAEITPGNGSPPPWGAPQFASISPPVCAPADLLPTQCTFPLSLPAGQSESYQVSIVPPPNAAQDGSYTMENCVTMHADNGSNWRDCHTVELRPARLSIEKTGPAECAPDTACEFTITISTGDQPFSGNVLLMDGTNVPAFSVTSISPATAGCGAGLPANPLACVVPVNLPANGSVSWTIAITPQFPGGQVVAGSGENCARVLSLPAGSSIAPGDYSFDSFATPPDMGSELVSILTQGGNMGESCVWFDVPEEDSASGGDDTPAAPLDLAIEKRWEEQTELMPLHGYVVVVHVLSGQLAPGDVITVTDPASGQSGFTGLGAPNAAAPWSCAMSGSAWSCSYTVPAAGISAPPNTTVTLPPILWFAANDPLVDSINCADVAAQSPGDPQVLAESDTANNHACVTVPAEEPAPVPAEVTIEKECDPIAGDPVGLTMHCAITITALNDFTGTLSITDALINQGGVSGSVTAITGPNGDWSCAMSPVPNCTISGSDFGAGDSATLDVTVTGSQASEMTEWRNCATASWYDVAGGQTTGSTLGVACDTELWDPNGQRAQATGPVLALSKTPTGPCVADPAAQSYRCTFALTVTNAGGAPFTGPVALEERFGQPAPRKAEGTGEGWACNPADGKGTSCLAPAVSIAPGAARRLEMVLTIPGLVEGGKFENCARLGVPEDPRAQAMVIQRLMQARGIDGGPVDGKPGRKTRAGIRKLQAGLGLEQTGRITPGLFTALALPPSGSAPEICATVDLPPMARPVLQCDRATTVARDGECVCRYARMYQRSKSACGCVKGTRFVKGRGCVKKRGDVAISTPKPAPAQKDCPKGTRYVKGKGCVKPERRLCPNGRPRLPGIGCVNITIGIGRGGSRGKPDGGP